MTVELPAVPPEAYEAAELARRLHVFATTSTCWCGFQPETGSDWEDHLARVPVDAAAPILRSLVVAEGRRQAAEAIRAEVAKLGDVGHLHGWLEWAARIAEGNTDATHHEGQPKVNSP